MPPSAAYPIALSVAGHELSAAGIGNVAAHPFHRGKGYMKDCMNMAMRDAVEQGLDFAVLGGRRQRYSYFGFEPAGLCAKFTLEDHNLRHAWGYKGEPFGYKAERVSPDDADALSAIDGLTRRQPSHPLRPADKLYDTLNNWESKVCKVLSPDGAFAGYFLATGSVSEIDLRFLPGRCRGRDRGVLRLYGQTGAGFLHPAVQPRHTGCAVRPIGRHGADRDGELLRAEL